MDIATFRTNFPEFTSEAEYPDTTITFWSEVAELMVLETKWKRMWSKGVQLFVAHNIVFAKANTNSSLVGGLPGMTSGPTASKTVGSVSVSYDTNAGLLPNAGHWNMTTYGKQFIYFARMFGAGAIQL